MPRIGTAFVEISGDFGPLRRQLAQFSNDPRQSIQLEVKADIDRTSFARAQAAGGRLGGSEEVKLRADVDTTSFARARAAEALLTKESSKLGDVFNRSQLSIGQQTGALAAGLPVVVDLAGALGALTASLGAATAGLGALAVGAGGALATGLGGIVAIAKPALASLKDLKTAQDAYTLAVQQYGKHSTQARTAFAKLQVEQKRAGPAAATFAGNLSKISREWKRLTTAGQTDFFGALNDALKRAEQLLPLFARSANRSMAAARGALDSFLTETTGPQFRKFIEVMTRTFVNSVRPLADAFSNLALILERIAVAVGPDVVRMLKQFDSLTQDWLKSTASATDLRNTIHQLVNQTEAWLKLIGAAARLIIAVLVPGMGQGKKAVEGITEQLQVWTRWVNAHPKEMRDFFKQGLETTKQLAQVLLGFLPTLFQISQATRPIARAFLALLKGLNSLKIGNVTALTALIGALIGAKVVKGLTTVVRSVESLAVAWGAVRTAAAGAAVAETGATVAGGAGGIAAMQPALAARTTTAGAAMQPLAQGAIAAQTAKSSATMVQFAKAAGGAALAITALVGAIEALRTNFLGVRSVFEGFFAHVLKPLGKAFRDLIDTITGGHAGQIFEGIAKGLKALSKPLGFVVRNLTKFIGLLAIGGITSAFAVAIGAMVLPLYVFIKGLTLVIKTLRKLPDVAKAVGATLVKVFAAAWQQIKQVFTSGIGIALGAFKRFAGSIHDVVSGIGHVFRGLYLVIKKIATWIGNQINKVGNALGGLKDKIPDLSLNLPNPLKLIPGIQTGGMVVPGHGSGDKVPLQAMVEPGEVVAVLNRKAAKQWMQWNDAYPRRQGGIVDRTGVPHFAAGGFAGMQPGITSLAKLFIKRFGGYMSSGLRPGDSGFHGRGLAADIVPANWNAATRYANTIGPKLLEGIHQGPPGQNVSWDTGKQVSPSFWGASTWAQHVSHIHLAIGKAIKGAIGAAAQQIGKIKVKGKGPVADVAQATADRMRKQANRFLAKIAPKASMDTALLHGDGNVEKVFAKVAKKLSTSRTATLALGEAGFAESGMRDLSYGDASSQGALQLLASTASGLGISPHDEAAIASAFLLRGFAGKGGANALAARGLPAQLVAQGVQGSAFASGSNYAAQRGAAQAWMKRFGLRKGGIVPNLVKVPSFAGGGTVPGPPGQPRVVVAHGGEEIKPKASRYALTITNWDQGTGYMREIADDSVDGNASLNNQLQRMHR